MSPLNIVIIIIIIIFIYMFLRYVFNDPYTIQNLQNGQTATTINASSLATNGSNVPSSNFAYSIWFYINDFNYRYGEPKVIYGRMGALSTEGNGSIDGISGLDPCPAVVLGAIENNLQVSVGCYPGINQQPTTPGGKTVVHTCSVANVPIQKWVNLVVSVYGRTMDLYIDGKLVRTCLLPGVANINNNANIYVTPAGGFNGWTSKFQYYPNSLNPQEVYNIYVKGYGSNIFSNLFGTYQIQFSLIENGTTQSSVTI
jgi:hypothetical protein